MIQFRSATLGYRAKILIENVDFVIHHGDFIGIVGPNGSGKTTFLKTILGIIPALNGSMLRPKNLKSGYVPQRSSIDTLFPLRAIDVVLMGIFGRISPLTRISNEHRRNAESAIQNVGLLEKKETLFSQLSGGQQQRILLARALVGNPDILILDEPTNGLDLASETSIMQLIEAIQKKSKLTVILVSHFLHLVSRHAQQIGLIHDGKFLYGTTSELLTSESLTRVYGIKISVKNIDNKTVVLTP